MPVLVNVVLLVTVKGEFVNVKAAGLEPETLLFIAENALPLHNTGAFKAVIVPELFIDPLDVIVNKVLVLPVIPVIEMRPGWVALK